MFLLVFCCGSRRRLQINSENWRFRLVARIGWRVRAIISLLYCFQLITHTPTAHRRCSCARVLCQSRGARCRQSTLGRPRDTVTDGVLLVGERMLCVRTGHLGGTHHFVRLFFLDWAYRNMLFFFVSSCQCFSRQMPFCEFSFQFDSRLELAIIDGLRPSMPAAAPPSYEFCNRKQTFFVL